MTTYKPTVQVEIITHNAGIVDGVRRIALVDGRTLSMDMPAVGAIGAALAMPTQGQRLRALRRAYGVAGTAVSELFGIDRVTIYQVERNLRNRSIWVEPLCQLWGVDPLQVTRFGLVTIDRDDTPFPARLKRWMRMQGTTLPEIARMCSVPYHAAWEIATGRRTESKHIATIETMMHGEALGA